MTMSLVTGYLVKIIAELGQMMMKADVSKYFNMTYNNFIENAFFRGFIYSIFEITFLSVL